MALQRLPLVLSGYNFTEAANRTGYAVDRIERTGSNGFTSLAGTKTLDILKRAWVIRWPLNALWSDEIAQLLDVIESADYIPTKYFNLKTAAEATGYFHGTIGTCSVPFVTSAGIMVRDGAVLTLEEY